MSQRVDSGFSTCCLSLLNTLQRYEELVNRCRALARYGVMWRDLSYFDVIRLDFVRKILAKFMVFLYLCRVNQIRKKDMKSYFKYELARAAGVSTRTFGRWLRSQNEALAQWGVTPQQKLLPPVAVLWICRQYGIDEGEL